MVAALISLLFGLAAALALAVVWLSARSGFVLALALLEVQERAERGGSATGKGELTPDSARGSGLRWPAAPSRRAAA